MNWRGARPARPTDDTLGSHRPHRHEPGRSRSIAFANQHPVLRNTAPRHLDRARSWQEQRRFQIPLHGHPATRRQQNDSRNELHRSDCHVVGTVESFYRHATANRSIHCMRQKLLEWQIWRMDLMIGRRDLLRNEHSGQERDRLL